MIDAVIAPMSVEFQIPDRVIGSVRYGVVVSTLPVWNPARDEVSVSTLPPLVTGWVSTADAGSCEYCR